MCDPVPDTANNLFPLSFSQQNIWNLEQAYPGTSINHISTTIRVEGRVDFLLLQQSIQLVLKADATLRTRIVLKGQSPFQYIVPFSEESFPVYDFSNTSEQGFHSFEAAITRESLPILEGPLYRFALFRIGENSGGIVVKLHHIISDGWSQMLLCNRIGQAYLKLLSGEEATVEPVPSYQLHVEEEQQYLASRSYEKDRIYWEKILQSSGESSVIKTVNSAAVSPVGCRSSFQLPQTLNHAIYSFCAKHRVAPFAVLYMALAIYFKRIGGTDRFTIGVPIVNRTNFTMKQCTGMFVSTLPFLSEINDEWSLEQLNLKLMETWYELLRHQRFPLAHITAMTERQDSRMFHIALSYQDSVVFENRDTSVLFSGRWHYSGYQAEQLCIHLSNMENRRCYSVDYDYLTQFFSEEEIGQLHFRLMNILKEALSEPERPIHRLSVLSAEEHEQVLYTFNHHPAQLEETGVYPVFADVVREHPNRVAAICGGIRLTYQTLEQQAAGLASQMETNGEETVAAILLPRGFSLFRALIGALHAGCAYLFISPDLPLRRIEEILSQSGARYLISCGSILEKVRELSYDGTILDIDTAPTQSGTPAAVAGPEDLAYLVYTSGSTGKPKGVEITQRSLLNFAQAMRPYYGKGAVLSVCSTGFDAFVIESIAALLNGRTVILPTEEELESPRQLARLITGFAAGFLSVTPSRLAAFLKEPAFRHAMRGMESIVCGGEDFPASLLKQLERCTPAQIYNQYGPSEATVGVSIKQLNHCTRITAGAPLPNCKLYVLDRWMNPLPIGVYGKLYIGGACVARGYRAAPDLTAQSFLENPFETGERLYDTGDIACWTPEGEIRLAGRSDSQVKLRGLRIELQEVSACLLSHPKVKAAAAKVCSVGGQELLAAYYCSDTSLPDTELLAFAADYLPRYMIPACLVQLPELPMTSSGKVDEARLPPPNVKDSGSSQPETALEQDILAIFRQVLEQPSLSATSDYFMNGGNSLNAMESLSILQDETGIPVRVSQLYACRTARRLAELLAQNETSTGHAKRMALKPAPVRARYPLSPVQQGIYVEHCMDPSGFLYHMPGAFALSQMPDLIRLEQAFRQLIADDVIFRTAFLSDSEGVYSAVLEQVPFSVTVLNADTFAQACAAFLTPFELMAPPLLHAAVWEDPSGKAFLFLDTHHIISDGLSTPLLLKRLNCYYNGTAAEVPFSFLDYLCSLPTTDDGRDQQYWKEHLNPLPEPLTLPTDFPRSRQFDHRGAHLDVSLSENVSRQMEEYCQTTGSSPYTLLLAAFGVLLSAVSGKERLTVGTPVSVRTEPDLQDICGPFIHTLPACLAPERSLSVKEYLQRVHDEVTGLLDHRESALEDIVSALSLPRSFFQNPLFQVSLSMRPFAVDTLTLLGERLDYRPIETGQTKTEMHIEAYFENGICHLGFEYAASLFSKETIAFYGRCMQTILKELLTNDAKTLEQLSLLSPQDEFTLLRQPNHLTAPYLNLPIHQMIQQQALLEPDTPAVIWHNQTTTRGALEELACRYAGQLIAAGIQPGERIGLAVRRTPDLFAAMLGILKAGCAYIPLLSSYPEQRIDYMLEAGSARLVYCDQVSRSELPDSIPALVMDPTALPLQKDIPVGSNDLIHIIFTSGSTGRPKGAMIPHSAVSNLFCSMRSLLGDTDGPILSAANQVFDIFTAEGLIPLGMGKPIILCDEEEMLLPRQIAALIQRHKAACMQLTASRLQMCLSNNEFRSAVSGLQMMIIGGESASPQLIKAFAQACNGRLINMYGPTETTVSATMSELRPDKPVTIGRPMHNTRVYILDEHQRPVLPTACGELYIAGEGVAKGYSGRPDLTEAAFLPDLYSLGQKMYRTGDLGRLRIDGSIDFLGRRDGQLKMNGQRVETGEIENVMLASGLALQAVVLQEKHPDGSSGLVAVYIPKNSADPQSMENHLRRLLPAYMIPGRIIPVDSMSETPSGKIDRRALESQFIRAHSLNLSGDDLSEPISTVQITQQPTSAVAITSEPKPDEPIISEAIVSSAPIENPTWKKAVTPKKSELASTKEAHASVTPERLLSVWREVLRQDNISADRSFFDAGGTSLGVLNVLSRYDNIGLTMTMAEFYEHPTAKEQAALLSSGSEAVLSVPQTENFPRIVPAAQPLPTTPPTHVFLTGATGFFGAHLLRALLEQGVQRIYCLVRGDTERLTQTLDWYFGAAYTAYALSKTTVITGDVSKPSFGLSDADFSTLSQRIDAVYHCAADVRHYAADRESLCAVNQIGVKNAIALAKAGNIPLHHISTASIAGERLTASPNQPAQFTEDDFDIGQNWKANAYVESKFLAEAEIYQAMQHGLNARVYRLGRLVGRASDGVFQKRPETNAAYLLLRAIYVLGALPQTLLETPVDLTPVDWCADAVTALHNCTQTANHLFHPAPPSLFQVAKSVCPHLQVLTDNAFSALLHQQLQSEAKQLLAPLLDHWNRQKDGPATISLLCEKTQRQLDQAGFHTPIPPPAQLLRGISVTLTNFNEG
jgi:amino acid adenylation domain-containing protein/thioester reductase-like protein